MDRKEYEIMYLTEDTHWWYRGMARITRKLIEEFCCTGKRLRILDAGCGTGGSIGLLSSFGQVFAFDLSPHALQFCLTRRMAVSRASVMALPFEDRSFDLVTSFDVLYFKGIDDRVALRESARVLVPGGRMLIRVPAFDWLRGVHDVKVSTHHRYTLRELRDKMAETGLEPEFINYANMFLLPLVFLKRLSEKWLPPQKESDLSINLGSLSTLLELSLSIESRLITKLSFPFGTSLIAVGRKG
jgi:SAM-dependent methyltransferase